VVAATVCKLVLVHKGWTIGASQVRERVKKRNHVTEVDHGPHF
jgi:hypothetical protein